MFGLKQRKEEKEKIWKQTVDELISYMGTYPIPDGGYGMIADLGSVEGYNHSLFGVKYDKVGFGLSFKEGILTFTTDWSKPSEGFYVPCYLIYKEPKNYFMQQMMPRIAEKAFADAHELLIKSFNDKYPNKLARMYTTTDNQLVFTLEKRN